MTYIAKPRINAERLGADFDALSEIGATIDGGISRLALSNEDIEARAWLAGKFEEAGVAIHDDEAGNLSGVLRCPDPDARTLLIGSHLDTVPNGGRYDGSVGVLAGLEVMRSIQEAGLELPFHLEVIDFTDEEGCWQSLFGSRALTGSLEANYMRDNGMDYGPFRAALYRAGIRPADVHRAHRDSESLVGFLELHIEQGYWLSDAHMDIGVVTGIVGRAAYEVTFFGEASHSGTTRLSARRDALRGAAEFICQVHDVFSRRFPDGVINCGNVTVQPGTFNIIPSQAMVRVECRHADREQLAVMEDWLIHEAAIAATERSLTVDTRMVNRMPAATMSGHMVLTIEQACRDVDASMTRMTSLAGHDAQMLSNFTPTGMIFIPSVDGISHSPKEFTRWDDVLTGVEVLLQTVLRLAEAS